MFNIIIASLLIATVLSGAIDVDNYQTSQQKCLMNAHPCTCVQLESEQPMDTKHVQKGNVAKPLFCCCTGTSVIDIASIFAENATSVTQLFVLLFPSYMLCETYYRHLHNVGIEHITNETFWQYPALVEL
jgi:hypothetical protein